MGNEVGTARRRTTMQAWPGIVTAGVVGVPLALSVLLGVARWLLAEPAERGAAGLLATAALCGIICAPAVLAVIARGRRDSSVLFVAACCCLPSFFLSWGATLPMLIPAVLLLWQYVTSSGAGARQVSASIGLAVGPVVLLSAAVAALQWTTDPVRFDGGAIGDVVTLGEAAASCALVVATILTTLLITRRSAAQISH